MAGLGLGLATVGERLAGVGGFFKPVGSFLTKIPKPVWEALAVIGYALACYAVHQRAVHEHDQALIAANNAQWQAHIASAAGRIQQQAAQIAADANQLREANDEANSRIAIDAGDLRMRGPGKAVCPGRPVRAAATGQPQPTSPEPDAARPALPADDLAAVPWPWLVNRAEEHDSLRAEVLAWRKLYAQIVAMWPKASAPKGSRVEQPGSSSGS